MYIDDEDGAKFLNTILLHGRLYPLNFSVYDIFPLNTAIIKPVSINR